MSATSAPLLVGLTGGIAAGKTTVAQMFAELGAAVVDADQIARDVVAPGTALLGQIVARFGPAVLAADGGLDRTRLGALVFADPEQRAGLEALTHPAIAAASMRRFAELAAAGARVIIYEAALLVETGRHQQMDQLVVVVAAEEVRVARLMARHGLSRAEAEQRLVSQLPQAQKAAVADHVIENSGAVEQTKEEVERVWRALVSLAQSERTTRGARP